MAAFPAQFNHGIFPLPIFFNCGVRVGRQPRLAFRGGAMVLSGRSDRLPPNRNIAWSELNWSIDPVPESVAALAAVQRIDSSCSLTVQCAFSRRQSCIAMFDVCPFM